MKIFKLIILKFFAIVESWKNEQREKLLLSKIEVGRDVRIAKNTIIDGNVVIGNYTYINNYGRIVSGEKSKVAIGNNCAIGRFFSCASRTHDMHCPTPTEAFRPHLQIERDIKIGDNVWIGDGVTIREGVSVGNFAIIGANSVVVKNVQDFEIVGGVPARHIRFNNKHYLYEQYR